MLDILEIILLTVIALSCGAISFVVLRFLYRLTRPITAPPVFGWDSSDKVIVMIAAFFISMYLVGAAKDLGFWPTIAASGAGVCGLVAVGMLIRRDRHRHEHLRTHGLRVPCRVVAKSTPTRSGMWPAFVLAVESARDGERELSVSPGEYHAVTVGDSVTLIVHPQSPRHWLLETKGDVR